MDQNPSIFFQSLGCPKNLVDAEVMLGITQKEGYQVVPQPEAADIIVLNTCSFIEASKRESIQTLLDLAQYKTRGKCQKLVVSGCLPQRYREELVDSFPEVDAFIGTGQYGNILQFLESEKRQESEGFKYPKYLHGEATPRVNSQPFFRAYLKISEGCIKNCSFCIIPKIRGTLRSRTIPSLVAEAERLVAGGVRELNLIGQDLTDYGRDLRDGTDLVGLLKALAQIEDLRWIRLFYVYPDELSDALLELIASEPKICKYLDMPVQHVSDSVLRGMNRKTTGTQIRERIARLRERVPNIVMRTTVLVGFPGETEQDFEDLLEFIEGARFEHLGAFAYSKEENTKSFDLPDQLPKAVKVRRQKRLLEAQARVASQTWESWVGRELEVLVEKGAEGPGKPAVGRFAGQAPEIDGVLYLEGEGQLRPGMFVTARVVRANTYDLFATLT